MRTTCRPLTSIVSGWPPPLERSTRAPYRSFLRVSSISPHLACVRHDFAGEQLHALARLLVRHRTGLAAGEDDAAAEFLLILLQLLPHRRRAADDGEDSLLDVVP